MWIDEYFHHIQQIIERCPMVSGERIFRYDNAKHHPTVRTFPHHKHIGPELITETVIEAPETSLDDVLREIVQQVLATM